MAHIATIEFVDRDSGDEGFAGIRVVDGVVGLTLSLRRNGDIEVFVDDQVLDQLLAALGRARVLIAEGSR